MKKPTYEGRTAGWWRKEARRFDALWSKHVTLSQKAYKRYREEDNESIWCSRMAAKCEAIASVLEEGVE